MLERMHQATGQHAGDEGSGRNRRNDFDALRLAAAVSVIFSHAFLLSSGSVSGDPLYVATHGQCVLGVVGVFVFFVVSGYLVTASFEATGSVGRFLAKRFLRIYPGYAACLLVLALCVGPLVSGRSLLTAWSDPATWSFVGANLVMNVEHNGLPGVRFTGFDIGTIVDGPLWSLPSEVVMYLMVALLGWLGLIRLPVLAALFIIGLICIWFDTAQSPSFFGGVGWLLPFFVAGMLGYRYRTALPRSPVLALGAALGLGACFWSGGFILLFPVLGAYLLLFLAFRRAGAPLPASRFGDLSFGLYIYGWPVEQLLLWRFGMMPWWALFAAALPITGLVAFVSWHLVERPALRLKPGTAKAA
jgi:peptidoglycan/LPS O-acetylase OafA/YrhL